MQIHSARQTAIAACLNKPHTVRVLAQTDSTTLEIRRLLEAGADSPVVLADSQSAGRGRQGRAFFSPAGTGMYLSYALPAPPPAVLPCATSLAGLAVCESTETLCGRPGQLQLKWPNDIRYGKKKLCGILTQLVTINGLQFMLVGVGMNCTPPEGGFPPELAQTAGSLLLLTSTLPSRDALCAAIVNALDAVFTSPPAPAELAQILRRRSDILGTQVHYQNAGETIHGTALDIDDTGALLLQTSAGILRLTCGEVDA